MRNSQRDTTISNRNPRDFFFFLDRFKENIIISPIQRNPCPIPVKFSDLIKTIQGKGIV